MERTETLSNSDVELHFTNRGGGIAQAILPNYLAEHGESVTLNSPARLPIGAIVDASKGNGSGFSVKGW